MIKYHQVDYISGAGSSVGDPATRTLAGQSAGNLPDIEIFVYGKSPIHQIAVPYIYYNSFISALKNVPLTNHLQNPDKIYISKNVSFPRRKLKYFPKTVNLEIAKNINTANSLIVDSKVYKSLIEDFNRYVKSIYIVKSGPLDNPDVKILTVPFNDTTARECFHIDRSTTIDPTNNGQRYMYALLQREHPTWISLDLCVFNTYRVSGYHIDLVDVLNANKPLVDQSVLMTSIGSGGMTYDNYFTTSSLLTRAYDQRDNEQYNIVLDSISSFNRKESRFYLSWLYYSILRHHSSMRLNTNTRSFLTYLEQDSFDIIKEHREDCFSAILAYLERSVADKEDFKVPFSLILLQLKNNGYNIFSELKNLKRIGDFKVNFNLKEELLEVIEFDVDLPENFEQYI